MKNHPLLCPLFCMITALLLSSIFASTASIAPLTPPVWVKAGDRFYEYATKHETEGMIELIHDGNNAVHQKLQWDDDGAKIGVIKSYPNAIKGGNFKQLSNGNLATFNSISNKVEIYNELVTSMITDLDVTNASKSWFIKDYFVYYDSLTKDLRFIALTQAAGNSFAITPPNYLTAEFIQDILLSGDKIAICNYTAVFIYNRDTLQFIKRVTTQECYHYAFSGNEIMCIGGLFTSSWDNVYKFNVTQISDGTTIDETYSITTPAFWKNCFQSDVINQIEYLDAVIIDGMLHVIVKAKHMTDGNPIYRLDTRYVAMDASTGNVHFQGEYDSDNGQHRLYIDKSKTLIIRDIHTGSSSSITNSHHLYFEREPNVPVIDLSCLRSTESTGMVKVDVKLRNPAAQPLTIHYYTTSGTAEATEDFRGISGNVVFEPGEQEKSVTVQIFIDELHEGVEHFNFHLQADKNAAFLSKHVITCLIDDSSQTYKSTRIGPNDLISDKSQPYSQLAFFDDSFLMYRQNKNESYQFTLFNAENYEPLNDLIVPEDLAYKLVTSRKSSLRIGNMITFSLELSNEIIILQFDASTGALITRTSFPERQNLKLINSNAAASLRGTVVDFMRVTSLVIYPVSGEPITAGVGSYTVFGTNAMGQLQAIRQDTTGQNFLLDTFDPHTGTLLKSMNASHVMGIPKQLLEGKLVCTSDNGTYCYDSNTLELLWSNKNIITITDVNDGQILASGLIYDIETGLLLEDLKLDYFSQAIGFMGRQIVTQSTSTYILSFLRREPNYDYPETSIKTLFVRHNQGRTTLTFPLNTPMPFAAQATFESKTPDSYRILTQQANLEVGATEIQIPVYVTDTYPYTDTNENPLINQTRLLTISNLQTGDTYTQEIGVHYLSPDFNNLGRPSNGNNQIILTAETKNVLKMKSNDDYFVVHHGSSYSNYYTQFDVYSKSKAEKVMTITPSLTVPSHINLGNTILLHGKYLIMACPGIASVSSKLSTAGYVDIYDMESGSKISTVKSPAKNDIGFATTMCVSGNHLAIASQKIPFALINPSDEYKPLKFSGTVYLFDIRDMQAPILKRTIKNKESGFGTAIAMNDDHIFISAPHANITYKNPLSNKKIKAPYSGAVYCYTFANTKEVKLLQMPVPFPLAEFGHSMSIFENDLCVTCARNPFLTFENSSIANLARQGFVFNTNNLQLTGWLTFPNNGEPVTMGGQFFVGHKLYTVETANYVSSFPETVFFLNNRNLDTVYQDPTTNRLYFQSRPLEINGDFSFWSKYKLGNYGNLNATVDFNQNGVSDWNEYLNEHKSYFQNPLLYEEINTKGYGTYSVDYEHLSKFPLPPAGSWADWINN